MGSAFCPNLRRAQRYVVFRNWRTADKEAPVVHLRSWDRPRVSFPTINGEVASPTRGGMDGRNRAVRINGACVAQRVAASVGCWRCSRSPRTRWSSRLPCVPPACPPRCGEFDEPRLCCVRTNYCPSRCCCLVAWQRTPCLPGPLAERSLVNTLFLARGANDVQTRRFVLGASRVRS